MGDQALMANRITNGQSEVWLTTKPEMRRIVATNCILHPIRTTCPIEESEAFHKALAEGSAHIPLSVAEKLIADVGLGV
jgi:hypothetical protein